MSQLVPDDPAAALLAAASEAMPGWAARTILARSRAAGSSAGQSDSTPERVSAVAQAMADDIIVALTALLQTDVAEQSMSPLALIRRYVGPANTFLLEIGAVPPRRDEFDQKNFPDDPFGVGPTSWSDIDPSLHEPGLIWGAWKAMTVMQRHATDRTERTVRTDRTQRTDHDAP